MKKFTFISGGARSGKSRYAIESAKKLSGRVAFIATAEALDEEMKERIRKHKEGRPEHWGVIEESRNLHLTLPEISSKHDALIIDCMGLLISNLMTEGKSDGEIEGRIKKLISRIKESRAAVILVSNEAGMGIVPGNASARRFRDLLGLANQKAAEAADEVILMFSGIPVFLKGEGYNAKTGGDAVKD